MTKSHDNTVPFVIIRSKCLTSCCLASLRTVGQGKAFWEMKSLSITTTLTKMTSDLTIWSNLI